MGRDISLIKEILIFLVRLVGRVLFILFSGILAFLFVGCLYLIKDIESRIGFYFRINASQVITLAISIPSVIFTFENFRRNRYSDKTNFRIVQNLWDPDYPRFSLINESTRKLNVIPPHFYIMAIPSKIYWHFNKSNENVSFLTLSPFSYQVIYKQTHALKTTGEIETSYLPKNFYVKEGSRNSINSGIIYKDKSISVRVITLPMILLITKLRYKYLDKAKRYSYNFLSTPIVKRSINYNFVNDVMSYIHDNADLEIKPNSGESIYSTANKSIVNHWNYAVLHSKNKNALFEFIGGKAGGYNFILKQLNQMISPQDPMEKFIYENYKDKL